MNGAEQKELVDRFIAAWNSQDVGRVLSSYTEDVVYRDPNTRGEIHGANDLRRYLEKLFARWTMRWLVREFHPFAEGKGLALLWRATLAQAGGRAQVQVDGMDLIELEGERVKRNEVYFDRNVLTGALSLWQRLRFLLRT